MLDVLSKIETLTTRENITLALSILGSIGTVSGWIYYWLTNRKNLTMRICEHWLDADSLIVFFQLTNNSRLAISINDISVFVESIEYHCNPVPESIISVKSGDHVEAIISEALPLSLAPLCGASGYLCFPFEPEIQVPDASSLCFVVRTNRGKAIKMQLPLGRELHVLL